jgi:hypothetical protein
MHGSERGGARGSGVCSMEGGGGGRYGWLDGRILSVIARRRYRVGFMQDRMMYEAGWISGAASIAGGLCMLRIRHLQIT